MHPGREQETFYHPMAEYPVSTVSCMYRMNLLLRFLTSYAPVPYIFNSILFGIQLKGKLCFSYKNNHGLTSNVMHLRRVELRNYSYITIYWIC